MLNPVASQIMVFKCIISDTSTIYIEIDSGTRTIELHKADGNTYGVGLELLCPKAHVYELGAALRFANNPDDVLKALEALGYPKKLKTTLLRTADVAQRITIDLFPNPATIPMVLPEKKTRRKKSEEPTGEGVIVN